MIFTAEESGWGCSSFRCEPRPTSGPTASRCIYPLVSVAPADTVGAVSSGGAWATRAARRWVDGLAQDLVSKRSELPLVFMDGRPVGHQPRPVHRTRDRHSLDRDLLIFSLPQQERDLRPHTRFTV